MRCRLRSTFFYLWGLACRGDFISPGLINRRYRYRESYQFPYSLNKYIRDCESGLYNFSSAQVRSRSFRCERLHIPDLTWRQRSHSRSYATNCPNFNLVAIVCEPSYEIKDFGLGHEQASPYRQASPLRNHSPSCG